jgi:hypothetical protein
MQATSQNLTSVLLLSTGRTGTMFFANLFRELIPQADVYHEAGERSRLIQIFTHAHMSGLLPKNAPLWAWRRAISHNLNACTKDYYIDSNNQLYGLAALMPTLYPNLKVIHIVRDPRDYVRSHLNWSKHRLKSFIANYLTPFWQPNAFLLGKMGFGTWQKASQFERFAWIWDFKNRFIEKLEGQQIPYLRVRFEDFFGAPTPETHFNNILAFIGHSEVNGLSKRFQRPVNPNRGQSFPSWPEWNTQQCQKLQQHCGDTMQRYGYGDEPAWVQKLASQNGRRA